MYVSLVEFESKEEIAAVDVPGGGIAQNVGLDKDKKLLDEIS